MSTMPSMTNRCKQCGQFDGKHHPWEPRFEPGEPKPAKWRYWRWALVKSFVYEETDDEWNDRQW